MGVVYEATDTRTGGRVAVKKLKLVDPEAIARFKNEFRALADVAHPNLVSLYELLVEGGDLVLSMELIEGRDLLRWLRPFDRPDIPMTPAARDPLATASMVASAAPTNAYAEETEATAAVRASQPSFGALLAPDQPDPNAELPDLLRVRDTFSQLATGIAAIHREGMLHRDLKPSNVMVTDEGRVVVLDFGIITSMRQASLGEAQVVGTPAYMAPEQAAGQELTPASDWYSMGVMLYRSLCGRLPFAGRSEVIMAGKQTRDPTPIEEAIEGVPDDLARLCGDLLARDARMRPDAQDILRRLGAAAPEAAWATSMSTSVGHLVGRGTELARLHDTVNPRQKRARLAIVSGASGLGKSRLMSELADNIRSDRNSNQLVFVGRCRERESIAFKALDQIVDLLVGHLTSMGEDELAPLVPRDAPALAHVFPVFRRLAPFSSGGRSVQGVANAEIRRRCFAAFRQLLVALSKRRPLALLIDDVQWGDEDSAQLLIEFARGPSSPDVAIVVAHRDEDESVFVTALRDLAGRESVPAETVELSPLDRDSSIHLALGCLGQQAESLAKANRIADEANGNPLFIEELAHHASFDDDAEDLSLEGVLRARVGRLPDNASRLLEFIAVPGQLVPLSSVIRATGSDDQTALGILRAGSFVRSRQLRGERAVECYHNRVRELVVDDLEQPRRVAVSSQWVKALEQLPNPDPELVAVMCDGAEQPLRAAEHWLTAARRAEEGLAFVSAARLYGRAAERFESGSEPWSEATVAMANCYRTAGRGREAARAFTAAAEQSSGLTAHQLEILAADSLMKSGAAEEGRRRAEAIMRAVGVKPPGSKFGTIARYVRMRMKLRMRGLGTNLREEAEIPRAELVRFDAVATLAEGIAFAEPLLGATLASQVLHMALELGEPRRLARALLGEAATTTLPGPSNHERTRAVLDLLAKLAEDDPRPITRGHHHLGEAWAGFQEGRWRDGADNAIKALELYRNHCVGTTFEISLANQFACFSLPFAGDFSEVDGHIERTLRDARERGDVFTEVNILVGPEAHACIRRGNAEQAYRVVDEALNKWSPRGFQLQHYNALHARLTADLHLGDFDRAEARIADHWHKLEGALMMRVQVLRSLAWHLRGRLALARAEKEGPESPAYRGLVKLADSAGARLEREKAPYVNAMGRVLRAGAANLRGQRELGLERLKQAEDMFAASATPQYEIACRVARLRLDDSAESRAQIDKDLAWFRGQDIAEPERVLYTGAPGFGIVE